MAANWWADPMPPGWEAKWDPGQKRYFFIDHSTKKTSWVDPRSPEGRHLVAGTQRPAPQPRQQAAYGNTPIPLQSMSAKCVQCHISTVSSRGETCALCKAKRVQQQQPRCAVCNAQPVKAADDVCTTCMMGFLTNQETSFINQASVEEEEDPINMFVRADEQLVRKLKEEYPMAIESHVRSAIESNNNEEAKARHDLEKRGYKKISPHEIQAEKMMEKLKHLYQQCGDDLLKTTIISCNCVEATTRKKLRELGFLTREEKQEEEKKKREEKSRKTDVERKIRSEFPSVSSDLIAMALESSGYKEVLTRSVLKSMFSVDKPATSASRPGSAAAPKSSKAEAGTPGVQKQTITTAESGTTPKKVVMPAKKPPTKKTSPAKITTPPQPTAVKSSQYMDNRTKKITDREVRGQAPVQRVGPSKLAHGSDSTLPNGPQDSLLLTGYCDVMGPNTDKVRGPSAQVMGSRGACGADLSLVHGPAGYGHSKAVAV